MNRGWEALGHSPNYLTQSHCHEQCFCSCWEIPSLIEENERQYKTLVTPSHLKLLMGNPLPFSVQQIPQQLSSLKRYNVRIHRVINDILGYKELKKI